MTFVASPVNHWHELSTNGPSLALFALTPYKTATGYWVFVERGTQPAGATQGALVHGASYDTLLTSTTAGLRLVRSPRGDVLSY